MAGVLGKGGGCRVMQGFKALVLGSLDVLLRVLGLGFGALDFC